MKKYTLEDVEFIRARSNVTYDEAIALLDAYEGDVVRVMAELERSGKLRGSIAQENNLWESIKRLFRKGYEHRLLIKKNENVIVNFSFVFWIIALIFAPYLVIPAVIVAVALGYKITTKNEAGSSKEFSNMAYTAKENIKKAADTIKNEFKEEPVVQEIKPQDSDIVIE